MLQQKNELLSINDIAYKVETTQNAPTLYVGNKTLVYVIFEPNKHNSYLCGKLK